MRRDALLEGCASDVRNRSGGRRLSRNRTGGGRNNGWKVLQVELSRRRPHGGQCGGERLETAAHADLTGDTVLAILLMTPFAKLFSNKNGISTFFD